MKRFLKEVMVMATIMLLVTALMVIGCSKKKAIDLTAADIGPAGTATNSPIVIPSATPTWTYSAPRVWLDRCEDGNNQIEFTVPSSPGYWFTYDDNAPPDNGTTLVVPWGDPKFMTAGLTPTPFYMQAPGVGIDGTGTSAYAARMTGYVRNNNSTPPGMAYGFAGMGFNLTDPKGAFSVTSTAGVGGYVGIKFWYRGAVTGASAQAVYRLKLDAPGTYTTADVYGYQFNVPVDDSWTQFVHPFSDFTQEGWGATPPVTLFSVLSNLVALQWQTATKGSSSSTEGYFELWVDNIELY